MSGDTPSVNLHAALEQGCERVCKPRFTVPFQRGGKASGMFVVLSGKVGLGFGVDSDFDRSYGPGALLGLPSTLTRRNYCMTATVTEDAELGFWSPEALDSLLHNRPDLCEQLLGTLGEKMAENYKLEESLAQEKQSGRVRPEPFVQRAESISKTRRPPVAQVYGLSPRTTQVGPLPSSSGAKRRRLALSFAIAGALTFWLPDLVIHLDAAHNFGTPQVRLITILLPTIFLLAYLVARRFGVKRDFKWVGAAMLLGVWLTGGLFMMLAATASGGGFVGAGILGSLLIMMMSIIPIVTYILAASDGSLFALLAVTLGALLLCGVRASWILLTAVPSPPRNN
jgi:CRP-like cAMP-binding protein